MTAAATTRAVAPRLGPGIKLSGSDQSGNAVPGQRARLRRAADRIRMLTDCGTGGKLGRLDPPAGGLGRFLLIRADARLPRPKPRRRLSRCRGWNHGSADNAGRRVRLHHRRRRLGRLRSGQPPLRRPEAARAPARGGRQGQLDLVSHPGRLSLRHRQSARGLDVQDRAGARAQWPQPQLPARQGDRRLLRHQRDDLHARPGRRLRPLAPARPDRLGFR